MDDTRPPLLRELAFSFTGRCPYDGLQASAILPDGRWISVMQIPYSIGGDRRITYEVMIQGAEDSLRWLTPDNFDEALSESLST